MLYSAAMAAKVKRRDVGALLLLIGLELGLLCLLGAVSCEGDRDRARGAASIGSLTSYWPAVGRKPLPPEPAEAPAERPRPAEQVHEATPKPAPEPPVEVRREAAPAAPARVSAAAGPRRPPAHRVELAETPVDVLDPCGGELCCAGGARSATFAAAAAAPPTASSEESDDPDRIVIWWPASRRDDVVYRVFMLPGRRFVGSYAENWFTHLRKPGDPDCYKIQACDRTGSADGGPVTICITHRRTWG